MGKLSKELMDYLSEFTVCEIKSRVLDGITYTMLLKDNKEDDILYNRYMRIVEEARKCGYDSNQIMRVYNLSNGYIFDVDLSIVREITAELAKSVAKANNGQTPITDMINDMPEQRRKRDLSELAKYLKNEFDHGNTDVEVALFSKNCTNKIVCTCKGPNGEAISLRYNAYAIRHWDIESLNENYLIPAGFRVKIVQPCEILPRKQGVVFELVLESMSDYNKRKLANG